MRLSTIPLIVLAFFFFANSSYGQSPPPPSDSPVGNTVVVYSIGTDFTYDAAEREATWLLSFAKLMEMMHVEFIYPGHGVVWAPATTTSEYAFPIHIVSKKCVGTIYEKPTIGAGGGIPDPAP